MPINIETVMSFEKEVDRLKIKCFNYQEKIRQLEDKIEELENEKFVDYNKEKLKEIYEKSRKRIEFKKNFRNEFDNWEVYESLSKKQYVPDEKKIEDIEKK